MTYRLHRFDTDSDDLTHYAGFSNQHHFIKMAGPYKQVLAGLALIPDKDIPRISPKGERYMAYFTAETIEKIRNKFHKELMNNRVNVNHKDYINAYMIESYILDSSHRIEDARRKGIKDAVIGSWFVAYKIEDKAVFARALAGELRGFSVEVFVNSLFHKTPLTKNEAKMRLMEMERQLKGLN